MSKLTVPTVRKKARRPFVAAAAAVLAAGTVLAAAPAPAETNSAHWGNYQWSGGAEEAEVRAFWLFDRTGDPTVNYWINSVANAWNTARTENPDLPYVAVHKDDANVGKCFVNNAPGWSAASACMFPGEVFGLNGLFAANPDSEGHMIGGAFAVSTGLTANESFTVVCHYMGRLMGLENSEDSDSCMSTDIGEDEVKWYDANDEAAILSLYDHSENDEPTTTTTEAPETTTTTEAPETTTTTEAPATTTTTEAPATTTTLIPDIIETDPDVTP